MIEIINKLVNQGLQSDLQAKYINSNTIKLNKVARINTYLVIVENIYFIS